MRLRLQRHHIDLLRTATQTVHPIEACALLFGELAHDEITVKKIVAVPNKLQSSQEFEIDPETFVKVFTTAENQGFTFIGIFHSHPAPAHLSSLDRKGMKLWGDTIWLILSSTEGNFAAFQMKNCKVERIAIEIDD